ncbi:peroxide stress protein YaaA [Streptococcus equinus]|uniref:peroxide stress protein YaaA n=1 Tax=Streptococcus equinus TaxID=1335 RepID=UPI0012F88639|nr:peroxide stress protein YaaA [Streptococcus equinus]QGX45780.1 peroxide stress protein YaaA [Streptococcus equinus]
MKLLIPNAKELNTNQDAFSYQELSQKPQTILDILTDFSVEDLTNFYKINSSKADQEWLRLSEKDAKSYPAWLLYDGLMYRYMKRQQVSQAEQDYLDEHLRIATAFYGLVKPTDLIAPHRLDFQGNLKIGKTSLKQFWREDYDKVVQDDDLIISLLSSEFEQVFSPDIRKRMIKIIFMENRAGKLKIHSTISKKGRGRLVSLMAEKQIETLEDIKTLTFDGFSFSLEHSDDKTITFIRDGE